MFNDTPDRLLGVRRHMVFRQTSAVITVNIRSVYDDADDPDDVFMCVCVCVCVIRHHFIHPCPNQA